MITNESDEATLPLLRFLPVLEPDQVRAERVRARCRDMMARHQRRIERPAASDAFTAVVVQPALIAGLCIGYLVAVIYDVLRLHGHH